MFNLDLAQKYGFNPLPPPAHLRAQSAPRRRSRPSDPSPPSLLSFKVVQKEEMSLNAPELDLKGEDVQSLEEGEDQLQSPSYSVDLISLSHFKRSGFFESGRTQGQMVSLEEGQLERVQICQGFSGVPEEAEVWNSGEEGVDVDVPRLIPGNEESLFFEQEEEDEELKEACSIVEVPIDLPIIEEVGDLSWKPTGEKGVVDVDEVDVPQERPIFRGYLLGAPVRREEKWWDDDRRWREDNPLLEKWGEGRKEETCALEEKEESIEEVYDEDFESDGSDKPEEPIARLVEEKEEGRVEVFKKKLEVLRALKKLGAPTEPSKAKMDPPPLRSDVVVRVEVGKERGEREEREVQTEEAEVVRVAVRDVGVMSEGQLNEDRFSQTFFSCFGVKDGQTQSKIEMTSAGVQSLSAHLVASGVQTEVEEGETEKGGIVEVEADLRQAEPSSVGRMDRALTRSAIVEAKRQAMKAVKKCKPELFGFLAHQAQLDALKEEVECVFSSLLVHLELEQPTRLPSPSGDRHRAAPLSLQSIDFVESPAPSPRLSLSPLSSMPFSPVEGRGKQMESPEFADLLRSFQRHDEG